MPPTHRTGTAVVLVYALLLTATALVAPPGVAAVTSPFTLRYAVNTNGSILLRGNANLVCAPVTDCVNARQGLRPNSESLDNNGYVMANADADGDLGATTRNDSTATVAVPPGSSVLFAALYWSADTTAGELGSGAPTPGHRDRVLFRAPGSGWLPVTASKVFGGGGAYQGFADVTALVAGAGNGVYGVANIQAGLGKDRYAGWALAIAYRNPAAGLRALRLYDGYGSVTSTSGDVDITVGGFETPHLGAVRAEIGTVAYEGDRGRTGDALELDGTAVTDAANPANNFFNSTAAGTRDPAWPNLFGVDIDQFDATGMLGHAATSATLTLSTTSDTYYPGVVSFAIDLYAPKMTTTVTGTDVDGGDLLPGDLIEYRIEVRNDGNDTADDVLVSSAVPAWTSYVPGSLRIRGVPVTDAAGDDGGAFAAGRADLALGDIGYQGTAWAILRVRVDGTVPPGYAITNLVNLSYTGHTANVGVSGPAASVATPVAAGRADLAAGLTVEPPVLQRGALPSAVTYTGTVTNRGTALASAPSAELTLPSGVTPGALPAGCSVFAQVVTCALGPLVPGTTATVVVPATVAGTAAARPAATLGTVDDAATAAFGVNEAPVAVADSAATTNGTAVNLAVLGNDSDPDGPASALTATIGTPPGHGTAIVEADGTVTYTPALGWAGDDTFTYVLADADGGTRTATVTVRTANATPTARDDVAHTASATEVIIPVLLNDSDPNGDPLTVVAVTGPPGTVRIAGDTVVFLPSPLVVGQVVLGYTVSDGTGTDDGQILVDVANAAPAANNDLATVAYLGSVTIPVLANDSDGNQEPLTVKTVAVPSSGTAIPGPGDTHVVYQAAAGFSGTVTFDYTIADTHGATSTGRITVEVANAPPVAVDRTVSTPYRTPLTVTALAGALDPNGDPLTVSGATGPAHGLLTHHPDQTLTYTPDDGWSGTDSFTVTVADTRGGTSTATVTVTVLNAPPTARPEAVTLPTGQPSVIDVLANDEDPNGDPLTVTVDTPPDHGTASVSGGRIGYQPAPGWSGADSLRYTISDGRGGTDTATVTIELVNAFPVARADAAVTGTGEPVTVDVTANDSDPNGEPLTVSAWTAAAHGTVAATGTAGTLRYTPDPGFTGVDAFGYTAEDPHRASAAAQVTITVRNAAPVAVDDVYTVRQQGATTLAVLVNDTDANTGQDLMLGGTGAATRGTATPTADGTVGYAPAPGATGQDTFDYTVRDEVGGSDTGTVTVTIDEAPAATDDQAFTGAATPVDITVLTNDSDPENRPLTVTGTGNPGHGFATVQAHGTIRYAPRHGYTGMDTFGYTIRDPIGNVANARISVRVANASPVARPDRAAALAGRPVEVDVLANDTDDNPGQTLVISAAGPAGRGATTIVGDRVRYTPPAGWTGQDHFRYAVSDGAGGAAETTVEITVTHQIPYAVADSRATPHGRAVTVPVLANDLDPSGTLRVTAVTEPDHGTARNDGGRTVTYTPPRGFSGTAVFGYTAVDADGRETGATVTVTVGPPPNAPDREVTTPPGSPVGIPLPSTDEQGRPARVGRIGEPRHGTVRLNPDGTITYTPDPGFTGTDRFTYEIIDEYGNVAHGTIIVNVPAPVSPSPVPPVSTPPSPVPPSSPPPGPPSPSVPVTRTPARPPSGSPSRGPATSPTPGAAPVPPDLPTTGPAAVPVTLLSCLACLFGTVLYALGVPHRGRHRR
ncbi:Ig-like domain-containing protein [Actinoplanes sp. NPDC049802]|uniref:Ig-like domain-containing protein n=1 Tax=Actinoplanes sp. NPDC049802 TaxID=3154742 RepID=UPI0033E8F28E